PKAVNCSFSPPGGPPQHYVGSIDKFGVDIGYTSGGVLVWTVLAPTISPAPGSLTGSYGGATASATAGVGVGANVLVGGSGNSILLLHGNAESGAAWFGWVPSLARRFRVVRPDMRGFGGSTPMARDFPWTLDIVIEDFVRLMDTLGIERFHLVGAKIGGTIARAFAARRPERVLTLTVVGTPPPMREGAAERAPELAEEFERHGVEHWARRTMAGRLGD